jgi:hypothetical protein
VRWLSADDADYTDKASIVLLSVFIRVIRSLYLTGKFGFKSGWSLKEMEPLFLAVISAATPVYIANPS